MQAKEAPETLNQITALIDEIKALRFLAANEFEAKYMTADEQYAVLQWREIDHECYQAGSDAEEAIHIPPMTVADGLPAEYVELETQRNLANAIRDPWDKAFHELRILAREPDRYGLLRDSQIGCQLYHLANEMLPTISAGKDAASNVYHAIVAKIEPKQRAGSRVVRARQAYYYAWRDRETKAKNDAYEEAMKRLGGHEAKAAAKRAENHAEGLRQADINALGAKVGKLLLEYRKQP